MDHESIRRMEQRFTKVRGTHEVRGRVHHRMGQEHESVQRDTRRSYGKTKAAEAGVKFSFQRKKASS